MNHFRQVTVARWLAGYGFVLLVTLSTHASAQETVTTVLESDDTTSLAFSPDGAWLAGGGMDKQVRLWDTKTNRLARTLEGPRQFLSAVAFSPDSANVAAAGDDKIYVWDAASGRLVGTLKGHGGEVTCVAYSPDGKTLASGSIQYSGDNNERTTCELKLWDAATGQLSQTVIEDAGGVLDVAFSPDGKTLALAAHSLGKKAFSGVKLWDVNRHEEKQRLVFEGGFPLCVAFSRDGSFLASGGGYAVPAIGGGTRAVGQVKLWDTATGKLRHTLSGRESGYFRSVSFSPDSKSLASGSSGPVKTLQVTGVVVGETLLSETKLWDANTGKLLWNVEGDLGDVYSVAFSPDGTAIASCDGECVKLSDSKTGTTREVLMTTTRTIPK